MFHETSPQIQEEIVNLCCQLNNPRFEDFSLTNSVRVGVSPSSLRFNDVFHELILGYELSLRLDKTGWGWLEFVGKYIRDGITDKVIAAVLMSQLWMQNVSITSRRGDYILHSSVHKSQTDGLLRFAEILHWPHMREAREYAEDAYSNILSGQTVPPDIWDWLYGLTLPGSRFADKVMTTLVLATLSTK